MNRQHNCGNNQNTSQHYNKYIVSQLFLCLRTELLVIIQRFHIKEDMTSGTIFVFIRNCCILLVYKLSCLPFQPRDLHIISIQLFPAFFPDCFQISVYISKRIHLFI